MTIEEHGVDSDLCADDIYTAGLIIIGNEILSGRTADGNTPWIAERFTQRGVILSEVRVIPDIEDMIVKTVNELREQYDYVFTTGGIGPTHDDITAESIARAFDVALVQNPDAYQSLFDYYGADELTPARLKMAMMPEGAEIIPNKVSGAPGFTIGNVHVMAGVPRIMQAMFDNVMGDLAVGAPVLSHTVACQLAESTIADDFAALQRRYPDVQMGSYPHYRGGMMGLSLVLRTADRTMLDEASVALNELLEDHGVAPQAVSLNDPDAA